MTITADGMTTMAVTTTTGESTTTTGGTTTTTGGTTTTTRGGPAINPALGTLGGGDGGGTLVTAGGHPAGRNTVPPREESRAIWHKRLLRLAAEGGKEKTTALVGRV